MEQHFFSFKRLTEVSDEELMRPIVGTTDRRITFSSLTTAALPRIARLGLGRILGGFFRVFRVARLSSSVPKPSVFLGERTAKGAKVRPSHAETLAFSRVVVSGAVSFGW